MAELSVSLANASMTFGPTVMAEVSTAHGQCVIWPNCLSTIKSKTLSKREKYYKNKVGGNSS